MGRTPKPIDWKIVDDMIIKGETEKLICQKFDIDPTNLQIRIRKEFPEFTGFTAYAQSKRAEGLRLVRSHTFNMAMKGHFGALMHLSKHMRGEWDRQILETPPNQEGLDKDHIIMQQQHRIAELEAKNGT